MADFLYSGKVSLSELILFKPEVKQKMYSTILFSGRYLRHRDKLGFAFSDQHALKTQTTF